MNKKLKNIFGSLYFDKKRDRNIPSTYSLITKIYAILNDDKKLEKSDLWLPNDNETENIACDYVLKIIECSTRNDITNQTQMFTLLLNYLNENDNNEAVDFLYMVEVVMQFVGDTRNAYIVRKMSYIKIIDKYKFLIPQKHLMAMYFYYSLNEDEKNKQRIMKKQRYWGESGGIFFDLLTDKKINMKFQANEDKAYEKLIKDKKIAVIGPATNLNDIEVIKKDFELIVSINYKPGFNIVPDIAYYNKAMLKEIEKVNMDFLNKLKFISYKYVGYDYQQQQINNMKARRAFSCKSILVNGNPNMLQIILFDLLQFSPKCIKVFNVNFYAKKEVYDQTYFCKTEDITTKIRRCSFAAHNLLSQFEFTKELKKYDLVEFDETSSEILNYTMEEYAALVTECHGIG